MDYLIDLMKASPHPLRSALMFAAWLALCPPGSAQDAVTLNNGQVREGKITGVSGGNVRVQISGGAATGIPLTEVKEIRMVAPSDFETASAQLASGDAKGALAALQKINDAFAGLPAPWAERSAVMLADAKLAVGDKAGAKAAYENFIKTYPKSTTLANLGMARLAVDEGKYDEAKKLLDPVLAESAKSSFPGPVKGMALGQAHYLAGRISEAAGEHQAALEQYLKASAVFPYDRNAASDAQKRADTLRAEHAGLIAP
ncbi:MAG: tetratricopeptide repeat protein [Chthoniobacterales bacterium]|nr:tetratricopeptide repeat protein [Chthoniobacterales bacterium]